VLGVSANLHIGVERSALSVRKNDLYETSPVAVRALLEVESFSIDVWEPCCGPGSIVTVLRAAGHRVLATDLVDYGCCPDSESRVDFLMEPMAGKPRTIVTNPPFKLAGEFVERALESGHIDKVAMLLRLAFLESEERRSILENGTLARVYVFRNRLPMMHRAGYTGKKSSSKVAFAWFIWNREHRGPTELHRISWTPEDA
jgi:hypothetical protein